MHTTHTLRTSSFAITVDGAAAGLDAVLPGFGAGDRLGVVVRRPCGGVGASALILAAVTAFYDVQRARSDDFFIYPDYFLFHVGERHGDHGMLDVWPIHKEVVVQDEPEALLQAINDRGVTRLVVEDGVAGEPELAAETLASAGSRIVTALAYSAGGRVRDGDVAITGSTDTEGYVHDVLDGSTDVSADQRRAIADGRSELLADGAPTETYRRISLEEALGLLAPQPHLQAVAG
jgi:hypothetical protein